MLRTVRMLLVVGLVALPARTGHAQAPDRPAVPESAVPIPGGGCPAGTGWPTLPALDGPPAVSVPALPDEDRNTGQLYGHPILDGPPSCPPGWFAAVEVDPAWVHVENQLAEPVTIGNVTKLVQVPMANLGATVAPRFDLGYRFSQGSGELLASYRLVDTSGSGNLGAFGLDGGPAALRSRFALNVLDLDYASRELPLAMSPAWDMKWFTGVRLSSLYFDAQGVSATLAQRVTNRLAGVGPHAGLELWRKLGTSGLALFGRAETEILVGDVDQSYTANTAGSSGETDQSERTVAPVLSVQLGLGWTPSGSEHLRLAGGYLYEHWWNEGFISESRAQATVQGLFFRGEWRY
jgi:hypothetical protein